VLLQLGEGLLWCAGLAAQHGINRQSNDWPIWFRRERSSALLAVMDVQVDQANRGDENCTAPANCHGQVLEEHEEKRIPIEHVVAHDESDNAFIHEARVWVEVLTTHTNTIAGGKPKGLEPMFTMPSMNRGNNDPKKS
jgi:hypothetical protein